MITFRVNAGELDPHRCHCSICDEYFNPYVAPPVREPQHSVDLFVCPLCKTESEVERDY
jgi:hypothetical protein